MHRIAGYLLIAFGLVVFLRARRSGNAATRGAFTAVFAMLVLQMLLGIITILYIAPWHLALLHHWVRCFLFTLILRARYLAQYPLAQSVRTTP